MKIRIKGNCIRYRLTKTEVETFCKTGYFEETTNFGTKKLTYALQAKQDIETLDAEFSGDKITMFLATQKSKDWHTTNQIGFSHKAQKEDAIELSILLEKDFVCMDETVEDQSDNYPNPKAS